jgi:translation initiation factor IF-2
MTRKKGPTRSPAAESGLEKLEVVLKCDVAGTEEAVHASINALEVPGVEVEIIQSGIGNISKSDVLMAGTGSRLVIGFNVDIMPKLLQEIKAHGVEVRLYDTIYKITEDLKTIAKSQITKPAEDKIIGKARVIAIFKVSSKGLIIGCEVLEGKFEMGKHFRVITAMGPVYSATITSLQVENKDVKVGKKGQQIGIKITAWNKAKKEDLVECYEPAQPSTAGIWKPKAGVVRSRS